MTDTPMWFGPQGSLFGWLARPDGVAAELGVVLCSSVGEEEHNAHQTLRELAHALAEHGVASVRYDHHGTGDSLGRWGEPGQVAGWVDGVGTAVDLLAGTGVDRIGIVGMRVGAALATAWLSRSGRSVDALVLWDPAGGRDLLREGRARSPASAPAPGDAVDTPGYRYPASTATDLRALTPTLPQERGPARRTLVLTRTDRPLPRRVRAGLARDGVEWGPAEGQGELLDLPMTHNVVPRSTVAAITAWLVSSPADDREQRADADRPSEPTSSTTSVDRVTLDPEGRPGGALTETVVRLGPAGLVGVRTTSAVPTRDPLVILVNVASDRHVGPGRLWVDLARRWAGHGFEVLRVDQRGCGDSPVGRGGTFGLLYATEWLDDLPALLDDPTVAGRPVVFVSLCSGAYSALEAAFVREVSAVYAINPILHARALGRAGPLHDPRRRAGRPPARVLLPLYRRRPRWAAVLWRAYRQVAVWHSPMAVVAGLVRRSTAVVLVVSPNDARHFRESLFWSLLRAPRWRRTNRYRMLESAAVDHPLMTIDGQEWAARAITADLLDRYPQTRPVPARRREAAASTSTTSGPA